MFDAVFAEAYPMARRAAARRSAAAVSAVTSGLLDREDMEQQAMVALWKALSRFDPTRGSLRTFVERVIFTDAVSTLRAQRSAKRNLGNELLPSPELWDASESVELRTDLGRVLARLRAPDKKLASLLMDHTPTEVSRVLRVSRSTVYEGISRIRTAVVQAGLGPSRAPRSGKTAI